MTDDNYVTVYNYWETSIEAGLPEMSASKVSEAAIQANGLGDILRGTAEDVLVGLVGEDGHYRRLPTGWGHLDQTVPDADVI